MFLFVKSEEMTISGFYNGKNIYVQNPFSANLKDFCIEKIYVNSILQVENPLTSAILIDLSYLILHEPVEIRIFYKEGCLPEIINPEVLEKKDQFKFTFIQVNQYHLQWTTRFETGEGNFIIEKFDDDHWQEIGAVAGKELNYEAKYSYPSNSKKGLNRYRIKYKEKEGRIFYSNEVDFLDSSIND
ncbi:hypothetical protein BH23BAC1_BH23BAC1_11930 [soil metagenome]